ncbi:MAG: type II secretion system GspH family protein [Candidatus Accumulibacter sp.]|jgi:general secretion pathway protein G|nr:type II secretion system GspH family protein [Accumulibacter sp.]
MKKNRGFSFVELMMTLAIMGVLALVATPMMELTIQRGKERELRAALIQIREALDAYKRAVDQGQIAWRAGESGYPKSLRDLVDGVPDMKSPKRQKIYFLRRLPRDPMHPDVDLKPEDSWGKRSYRSPPDKPEAGDDVFDVFSLSDAVGLNGRPYREW